MEDYEPGIYDIKEATGVCEAIIDLFRDEYDKGIEQERQKAIMKMLERNYDKVEILDWGYTEEEYEAAVAEYSQTV